MKKKQIISAVVAVAVIAGAGAGITQAVRATTTSQTVTVFQAGSANYYYGGGMTSMSGNVVSDASQNVTLSGTETVSSVKVKEGEHVKEGQVLLTYDTTQTNLNLEREKLNRESIRLNIEVAEKNLQTLGKLRPVSDSDVIIPDDPGWNDDPGSDDEPGTDEDDREVEELISRLNTLDEAKLTKVLSGVENRQALVDAVKQMPDDKAAAVIAVLAASAVNREDQEQSHSAALLQAVLRNSGDGDGQVTAGAEDLGRIVSVLSEKDLANVLRFESWMYRTGALSDDEMKRQAVILGTVWQAAPSAGAVKAEEQQGDVSESEDTEEKAVGSSGQTTSGKDRMLAALHEQKPVDIAAILLLMNEHPDGSIRTDMVQTSVEELDAGALEGTLAALGGARLPDFLGTLGASGMNSLLGRLGSGMSASLLNQIPVENSVFENFATSLLQAEGGKTLLMGVQKGLSPDHAAIVEELLQAGTEEPGRDSSGGQSTAGAAQASAAVSMRPQTGNRLLTYRTVQTVVPVALDSGSDGSDAGTDGGSGSGSDDSSGAGSQLIPSNAQMTKDEITEEKKNQTDSLKSLKLDLAESDLKIKMGEKALQDGEVRAKMDGIVKKAGDPENPPTDGSAFLTVTSTQGLYVRGGVPELQLGSLHEGDHVQVMSYDSGGMYEAVVKDISIYPDESGQFGYGDDTTYYPFTAYIDAADAQLTNGEYVDITREDTGDPDGSMDDAAGSQLWLAGMFVREDAGGKYVYKRGDNNRLQKQYVKVGRLQDSSYQILSGLSTDDWITFPYGKKVKEGAKTREGTIDEIYTS